MTRKDGITVQCITCKGKKLLTFDEARALDSPPFCDRCYMPMLAVQANISRRSARSAS